jgi:hypothetical protein
MMLKLIAAFFLLVMSGCCRYLGICTSFNMHTSISPPARIADSEQARAEAFGNQISAIRAREFNGHPLSAIGPKFESCSG